MLAGDDFGTLASTYSEDKGSAMRNGELPWFGTGRMVPEFEQAAFALEEVGDVSEPVRSQFGWHIIKLLDKRDVASFEDAKADIERKIKRDERGQVGTKAFVKGLKKEYNFQLDQAAADEFVALLEGKQLNDSAFLDAIVKLDKPLCSFADKQYTQADFASYLKTNKYSSKSIASEIIREKLDAFESKELLAYEDTQLARKYPDFRFLSQEKGPIPCLPVAVHPGKRPVRTVRICYSKGGAMTFVSHLDVCRAFTRALVKSGLPVYYTEGFNPIPKLTFASPLSVGVSGEAELTASTQSLKCGYSSSIRSRSFPAHTVFHASYPASLCP